MISTINQLWVEKEMEIYSKWQQEKKDWERDYTV